MSGITIGTILFASLVLAVLMGSNAPLGPVAAIMIGAVVCCAAAVAGDNLQDLKCGYMIGATPWRQQVMLAIGAMSCALVMAPVLNLLAKAYGIGVPTAEHPNPLLAPQATLMASVAKGLFGGELPWDLIWIGVAIGAAIIICDEILKKRGAKFRTPVLAAAVGIYLPLDLTVPIFLGGLLAHLVERAAGVQQRPRRGGARSSQGRVVLGRPDHRRSADGHSDRHSHRDQRQRRMCWRCPPDCSSASWWAWRSSPIDRLGAVSGRGERRAQPHVLSADKRIKFEQRRRC